VRIRWCELARAQLGGMIECWLMADTPEAPEPEPDEFDNLTLDGILTLQDQATNQQRTGYYAEGIALALAAQASLLNRVMPEVENDVVQPDPVGFGHIDEQAQIKIRTVVPYIEERDPCEEQRHR
jgi:hypothetical protein